MAGNIRFPGVSSLRMSDLAEWAGDKIAARGEAYQKEGRVVEIAVAGDGVIVADVEGGEAYSVAVRVAPDGALRSMCTCPYEIDCKHGVAALLEYIARRKAHEPIREAGSGDKRLRLLEPQRRDTAGSSVSKSPTGGTTMSAALSENDLLQTHLQGLSKKQIIVKILALADDLPQARAWLHDNAWSASNDTKALRKELRREIMRVSRQEAWSNAWSGECRIPDYAGVRRKMRALLEAGEADALIDEGREFLRRGLAQIGVSHDEGETCAEIAECFPILARALRESARPEAEKLLWALDAVFADDYGVCEALEAYLREKHSSAAWSEAADKMLADLDKYPARGKSFMDGYRRGVVAGWIVHALDNAGRDAEALSLCEQEASKNGDYIRLVDRLMAGTLYAEAKQWIDRGIAHTERPAPGIAAQLRDRLREIHERQEDWPPLILLELSEFMREPGTGAFARCRAAGEKIAVWPALRQTLLEFLATGRAPGENPRWPLRECPADSIRDEKRRFPMAETLTAIAIHEKKAEDVLRWFDLHHEQGKTFHASFCDKAAGAMKNYAPTKAADIWKNLAEQAISRTSPSGYEEAARYLRKAGKILRRHGRDTEWQQYISGLRQQHFRKKRLLQQLDKLDSVVTRLF